MRVTARQTYDGWWHATAWFRGHRGFSSAQSRRMATWYAVAHAFRFATGIMPELPAHPWARKGY